MITFKPFRLEEKEQIDPYLQKVNDRSCRFSFGNMLLWSEYFQTQFAIVKDSLVVISADSITFPIGTEDPEPALQEIFQYCEETGRACKLLITAADEEYLDCHYPGQFEVFYSRDSAEYLYETEKLISLSGKKYQPKRNHINKFKKQYENQWAYEPITNENRGECAAMLEEWAEQNEVEASASKTAEVKVARRFLELMEPLQLDGGLLRAEGKVVAFTIGEPLRQDTYGVHIEKAFAQVDGAYPMINQQFAQAVASAYRYINREEDTGSEGLRKAKLSYHPVMFVENGIAVKK